MLLLNDIGKILTHVLLIDSEIILPIRNVHHTQVDGEAEAGQLRFDKDNVYM